MDSGDWRALPHRHRRHQPAAHHADHADGVHRGAVQLECDSRSREGILRHVHAVADGHDRGISVTGFLSLLRVLGAGSGADVLHYRRVGRSAKAVRGDQVFPLYAGGQRADAAGDSDVVLPALPPIRVLQLRDFGADEAESADGAAAVGLLGVLHRLRDQGADVPLPYVAARRTRGGTHGRLGHPGGGAAEDGDVRVPALLAAAVAAGEYGPDHRADSGDALVDRHYLRCAGLHHAGGLEEADCVFVGKPPWLLHVGNFLADAERDRGKRAAADQSRYLDWHALHGHRRDLRTPPHPRDRRVWRAGARDAEVRQDLRLRHAELRGPAAVERLRRRVHYTARRI